VCVDLIILSLISGDRQCVLPAGVEFYPSGFDANDSSTFPRSYPIVLTGTFFFFKLLQLDFISFFG
jgi:hypothetical protein